MDGREFVFVDTAGIRRKGKTHEMAEKLSVVMARRHIRMAHVALLVMDATEGAVGSDATIAGYAHEEGRALVICVNKWDLIDDKKRKEFEQPSATRSSSSTTPRSCSSPRRRRRASGSAVQAHRRAALRRSTSASPPGQLNRFVDEFNLERDRRISS